MKITDALLGEHGVLYGLLDHGAEGAGDWNLETVRANAEALVRVLKTHAHLENTLLFDALEPHFPAGMGPVAVMRTEHDEIEGAVERTLKTSDLEEGRRLLGEIRALAREHFSKEEQVLFPMAEQLLGAERLEELGQAWATQRGVTAR
jgi:hemerythrin-like domain-containing protein